MSLIKKCGFCDASLQGEVCELAAYRKTIDGREYVFCCKNCASKFEE